MKLLYFSVQYLKWRLSLFSMINKLFRTKQSLCLFDRWTTNNQCLTIVLQLGSCCIKLLLKKLLNKIALDLFINYFIISKKCLIKLFFVFWIYDTVLTRLKFIFSFHVFHDDRILCFIHVVNWIVVRCFFYMIFVLMVNVFHSFMDSWSLRNTWFFNEWILEYPIFD